LHKPAVWQAHATHSGTLTPPAGLFKFSAGQNVIHCVLDGFQSDLFREILAQNPDGYSKGLDGFTFFEEATGTFPSTQMSVPAMLCGEVYKNDVPTHDFLQWTNQGRTIGNVLAERGYAVDLVIGRAYTINSRNATHYSIAVPYGVPESQYERDNAAQLLDYALFRASPQPAKKLIYSDQLWLFQRLLGGMRDELRMRLISHRAFMDDLIKNMSVSRKRPRYKYLHLMTLHPPILLDESCAYVPGLPLTWNNRRIQARCALDQFLRFLDKLRTAGIYESSLIIVNGDHGTAEEIKMLNDDGAREKAPYHESLPRIASLALPLLAVKPPHARGPLKTSRAAVGLTDLPATISALLRLNEEYSGRSVFEVDPSEARERKFYFYDWYKTNWENEYFDYIDEFTIRGNPRDRKSWQFIQSLRPPRVSFETGMILFGTDQSNRFKRSGWGTNHKATGNGYAYNWAVGDSSFLVVALPKKAAVTMSARLKSFPFSKPQIISIKVDQKVIGEWKLGAPWDVSERKLVIPPDENRPEASMIEFSFSQHRTSGTGTGSLAVQFLTLAFQPAGE
jgi:Sulfatase